MATTTTRVILGVDVAKGWLDIHIEGGDEPQRIDNERQALDEFLKGHRGAAMAVEPTNTYHELLIERAHQHGLVVYLVSGYQIKHYGLALGQRMITDPIDARLIARYLSREIDDLEPHQPKPPQQTLLWKLLKRRAKVVQSGQQLRQSLSGIKSLETAQAQIGTSLKDVLAAIDKQIQELCAALEWEADRARLEAIPGVGRLTAQALLAGYHAGTFPHHDPFIAYLGLDVRAKESGKFKGQRKLTKRGDGEYRRLLYCAAMAASRLPGYFKTRYEALQARGLTRTAALVVLARKIATIAFHLLRQQVDYDPTKVGGAAAAGRRHVQPEGAS
jgi:transposase